MAVAPGENHYLRGGIRIPASAASEFPQPGRSYQAMGSQNLRDAASPPGLPESPSRWAATVFEHFRSPLYRYLLRRLRSAENAEDLAQEVYLRLLRASNPRQVRSPQAYVYRIALNVLYEFRLRERGDRTVLDPTALAEAAEELPDDAASPDEVYDEDARRRRFELVISRLPPMQRAVLRLAVQQDLAHAQIARALGISISTVRNHLYKGIEHCRHRLAETAGPDGKES